MTCVCMCMCVGMCMCMCTCVLFVSTCRMCMCWLAAKAPALRERGPQIFLPSTRQAGCTRSHEQCGMAEPHAALADAPAAVRLWDETHAALSPWLEA